MRIWNSTQLEPGVSAFNMEDSHLVYILCSRFKRAYYIKLYPNYTSTMFAC